LKSILCTLRLTATSSQRMWRPIYFPSCFLSISARQRKTCSPQATLAQPNATVEQPWAHQFFIFLFLSVSIFPVYLPDCFRTVFIYFLFVFLPMSVLYFSPLFCFYFSTWFFSLCLLLFLFPSVLLISLRLLCFFIFLCFFFPW
jgi:hypothetical protein